MLRLRIFLFATLIAVTAHAGLGPERFLTGLSSTRWRIVFDGTTYVAVWAETSGTFAVRIDERGDLVGDKIRLSTRPVPVTVAADHGVILAAWMEQTADGGYDVLARWLDVDGTATRAIAHRAGPPRFDQSPAPTLAATVTEGKFLVAFRGPDQDWIDVVYLPPHELIPVMAARVPAATSSEVAVAANGSSLLFAWGRIVPSNFVGGPGCCSEPRPVAVTATPAANLTSTPLILENWLDFGLNVGITPWDGFVVSLGHDEWRPLPATLAMISADGHVEGRVRFPLMISPASASFGKSLFLTLRANQRLGVGELFLSAVDGREGQGDWGFYRMKTSTMVDRSQLTTGASTLLASYELVGPVGQRGVAYQVIDPSSLPSLPQRPDAPHVASSIAGSPARITIAWQPVPLADRYRIQTELLGVYAAYAEQTIDGSNASNAVVTLWPDYEYRMVVIAEGVNGRSPSSDSITFRAPAFGTPRAPSSAHALRNSDGTITVSWSDDATNEDGYRVLVYGVQAKTVVLDLPANTHQVTVSPAEGVSAIYVYAYNASGFSPQVQAQSLTPRPRPIRH